MPPSAIKDFYGAQRSPWQRRRRYSVKYIWNYGGQYDEEKQGEAAQSGLVTGLEPGKKDTFCRLGASCADAKERGTEPSSELTDKVQWP